MRCISRLACILTILILASAVVPAQTPSAKVESGHRYSRLVIRNAMVIVGNGTPAAGPMDIVIEGNHIAQIVPIDPTSMSRPGSGRPTGDVEIDAAGKYVLPGLINAHAHLQDERSGIPQPFEYELKLWLACGITTVRDLGSDYAKSSVIRKQSSDNSIPAPRIFLYRVFSDMPGKPAPHNAEEARARVREIKESGADGMKVFGVTRDVMQALEEEAHSLNLRIAHHVEVAETNAWDDIKFGTTSIEHWYGIPDAALEDKVQNFPPSYNYNNEVDRFRYAGHLWREANWDKLMKVFDGMIAAGVAWDPTLDIYEASRDLQRAQNQPWFAEYLHPTLEEYFKPNPKNHGSYFLGWTSTDETFWKENYQIWMKALREFDRRGGLIGVGDDAGFIYQIYGFGLIRELELKQEAGFSTIRVIQQATGNNARILGKDDELGQVRVGYLADLIVVNGNPLENLKVLYPTGIDTVVNGKVVHTGGVEWTIKDGIPYYAPAMLADVKEIVTKARAARKRE